MFDRAVADALARQIDRAQPLPTNDRIRQIVRDEMGQILERMPNYDEVRRLAQEEASSFVKGSISSDEVRRLALDEARTLLGAIGFDVKDVKAQAATAAEVARWRETQATIKAVAMKILLSAVGAIGLALGTFWVGLSKR